MFKHESVIYEILISCGDRKNIELEDMAYEQKNKNRCSRSPV